jgi:xylulokinase
LKLLLEAKVDFDADLAQYETQKGVLTNAAEGEIFAPVAMWLEAIDLVLQRLKDQGLDFGSISGVSGAGMQHGTVFWSKDAYSLLASLDPSQTLVDQLRTATSDNETGCLTHPFSPNWQDSSTQSQCERFDEILASPESLAQMTGSKAHHRFSGAQILRFREKYPTKYEITSRISLVSSFVASILLGKIAPIDISDVGGMNLYDLEHNCWNQTLLSLVAGSEDATSSLASKLGSVSLDPASPYGTVSQYFVSRYGFSPSCQIHGFTGDNPATILALPLKQNEAIVSLGTSTTFLMSTPHYKPHPSYHFMRHPTTTGLYMFMLCYKNGALAREQIRDAINGNSSGSWDAFNAAATQASILGQKSTEDEMRLGLFFPRPEIVPPAPVGTWHATYAPSTNKLSLLTSDTNDAASDARTILESQLLSIRLRSASLVSSPSTGLPAQPSRIYLVGGGSLNPAIAAACGEVLGGSEGLYRLDIGGNACALGAAHRAVWGCERADDEGFEEFIAKRWEEEGFVKRIDVGYRKGIWERYGDALKGFEMLEQQAVAGK